MAGNTDTKLELINTNKRQFVIVVRYKPSPKGMAAGSMVDKVAGAVKNVTDKIDAITAHIPGVLQEQTNKTEPLDEGFNYHESYPKHWDKWLKETENTLKEISDKNEYLLFEFDSYDNLDMHVSRLEAMVKATISGWRQDLYGIHFVGLGQGGNIAADTAMKIKNSLGEYGKIESVLNVGTALSGDDDKKDFLNSLPNVAVYKNPFDLSSNAILYAKNSDKLIDTIRLSNQSPVKYMYSTLVIKITKILTQLLNGLTIGTAAGLDPLKSLVESLKSDIKSIIEDIFGFVKHLITSFKEFLKLPKIDQTLDKVFGNPSGVASDSVDRLSQFVKSFKDLFESKDKIGLDTEHLKLEKLFNFLVPPVLLVNDALNAITVDLENKEPANHLKEFTAEGAFVKPITAFDKPIATKDPYQQVIIEGAKKEEYDQLTSLIASTRQEIETLSQTADNGKREEIGMALSRKLMLPMIAGKTELLGKVLAKLPSLGNNPSLSKIQTDTITKPLVSLMQKIRSDFDFDDTDNGNDKELGLKKALGRVDKSIGDIKKILAPDYFKVDKKYNSLHFIYNSHNISLAEMPKELRKTLDQATNIYAYKLGKGFEYSELDGNYKPGSGGTKTGDILVVEEAEKQ